MSVTLAFESGNSLAVDVRSLQPDVVTGLSKGEIEKLPLAVGRQSVRLGDLCKVKRSSRGREKLILEGDTACLSRAGSRMQAGNLVIAGDAGELTGVEMQNGEIEVCGSAGDCLGLAMQGGLIRVKGNVGNWCGAGLPGQIKGMLGGKILVGGDAGRELGAGMRRGLIYIAGDAGEYTAAHMLSGSIFVAGGLGTGSGLDMRRGSLVAGRLDNLLPGFRPAGPADNEWVQIYLRWMENAGCAPLAHWMGRASHRFTGDVLESGKGEIIVYDLIE